MPTIILPADWPGFDPPRYTPVPDDLIDELLPYLSGPQLKIILYICRRTFGWKKDADAISLGQLQYGIQRRDGTWLDHGTGLSRSTLLQAIPELEAAGLIVVDRSATARQDNEANTYALRVRPLDRIAIQPKIGARSRGGARPDPALARGARPQETSVQETTQEGYTPPAAARDVFAYQRERQAAGKLRLPD